MRSKQHENSMVKQPIVASIKLNDGRCYFEKNEIAQWNHCEHGEKVIKAMFKGLTIAFPNEFPDNTPKTNNASNKSNF